MLKVIAAGRLGKNAEHRTTQGGTDICSFTVACDVGFGDNKSTVWVDVAKFGKGAEGLSKYLSKGDSVTVVGDLTTREYEGKTYLQVRADEVVLQGGGKREGGSASQPGRPMQTAGTAGFPTNDAYPVGPDLDDDIPF